MQAGDSGTVQGGVITLPSDCREVQSVRVNIGGVDTELSPMPATRLQETIPSTAYPIGYVTINNSLQLIGGADGLAYAITYLQEIPHLATAPLNRNWLITREPGLYLYGALVEASPYIHDDAGLIKAWEQQYENILDGMKAEDDRARYGNLPAMRVRTP